MAFQKADTLRAGAGLGLLLAVAGLYWSRESSLGVLLSLSVAAGALVPLLRREDLSNAINGADGTLGRWKARNDRRTGRFAKYFLRPLLGGVLALWRRTAGILDGHLRAGVRIAAGCGLVAFMLGLLLAAVYVVIAIAVTLLVFAAVFGAFSGSAHGPAENEEGTVDQERPTRRARGIPGLDEDEPTRVDPDSGAVQTRGMLGWFDSDLRIDRQSGIVQERGPFGWSDQTIRLDPESGIVQERGTLGWSDTDERFDPDSGHRPRRSPLGWFDS